jgi:hypothetical protein
MSNNLVEDMDLLERTRMDDVYNRISKITEDISNLGVFPPLVWVWTWDIVTDIYKNNIPGMDDEFTITKSLEEIWHLFWTQADTNGFTLEYGAEDCYEHIRDWMIDQDILIYIEEEEEEDEDE